MLRSVLFTCVISTFGGIAYAQSYAENSIDLREPVVQRNPLPSSHAGHERCHAVSKYLDSDPYCGPIRKQEREAYANALRWQPKSSVVLPDGTHKVGARSLFDSSKVTAMWNTDANWSGMAWLTRFKIPSTDNASAQPQYENASIDSCSEYAYQRYYGANRYLDTFGQYSAQRRYERALDVVANGIPAVNGTKYQLPLNGFPLTDYNYRVIAPFTPKFTAAPLPALAPTRTGTQVRNPFFAMPTMVAAVPDDGSVEWDELQAAYQASRVDAFTTYPSNGEFGYAQQMRNHADIVNLTAAEKEDIAQRVKQMRSKLSTALHGFSRCVTREFMIKSASVNLLTSKSALKIREYLEDHPLDEGYNDPVDQFEISLTTQLLQDSATASSAISNLIAADPKGTSVFAQMARTRMGSLLRLLNFHDAYAMQHAVSYTRSTFKSGTFGDSAQCNLNEDFAAVRELLIAEHKRGAAGCLSSSRRCDFSAQVFVEDLSARLTDAIDDIDEAKAYCVDLVGSGGWSYDKVPAYARDSVKDFETLLLARYNQAQAVLAGAPRGSSLPGSIGDRRDGGNSWGHPGTAQEPGSFGAGYTYSSEWGVNITEKTANDDICRLGGRAEGRLYAFATAFGVHQPLVDAKLSATTQQPNDENPKLLDPAKFSAKVFLLGKEVFTPIEDQPIPDDYHTDSKGSQEIQIVKTTILVGFVPVSLSVGFQFDYGFDLDLDFKQSTGCVPLTATTGPSLTLTGTVTPRAGASAVVSAYIDLFVVGAGVKGRLTLLEARLPFTSSVTTRVTSTDLLISASTSLDLILTELSGGLSFFVNVVGITVWEHEFFSWPGISQVIRLWHHEKTYPGFALNILSE